MASFSDGRPTFLFHYLRRLRAPSHHLKLFHPSTYFEPTVLLQWLSSMPQLKMLLIFFRFAVPNHDVERQLMRMPVMTPITLPNLRAFALRADSAYSEAILSRITASRLEDFQLCYVRQLTFSVPQLLQLMGRIENSGSTVPGSTSKARKFTQLSIPLSICQRTPFP